MSTRPPYFPRSKEVWVADCQVCHARSCWDLWHIPVGILTGLGKVFQASKSAVNIYCLMYVGFVVPSDPETLKTLQIPSETLTPRQLSKHSFSSLWTYVVSEPWNHLEVSALGFQSSPCNRISTPSSPQMLGIGWNSCNTLKQKISLKGCVEPEPKLTKVGEFCCSTCLSGFGVNPWSIMILDPLPFSPIWMYSEAAFKDQLRRVLSLYAVWKDWSNGKWLPQVCSWTGQRELFREPKGRQGRGVSVQADSSSTVGCNRLEMKKVLT